MKGTEDSPGVRFPPPLIFLGCFLAGLPFRDRWPFELRYGMEIGAALMILSAVLIVWGIVTMARARTQIYPNRPASALVDHGPFRFTRNPLYLGMVIAYVAAALWIGSPPSLLLLPVALVLLHVFVIRREEAYLERRFGDEYRAYRARVRRWI